MKKIILWVLFAILLSSFTYAFPIDDPRVMFYYGLDGAGNIFDNKENDHPSVNVPYVGTGQLSSRLLPFSTNSYFFTNDAAQNLTIPTWSGVNNITVGCFINHTWGGITVSVLSMLDQQGGIFTGLNLLLDEGTSSIFVKWGDGDAGATTIYEAITQFQYFYYIVRINSTGATATADVFINDTLMFSAVGEPLLFRAGSCITIGGHDANCAASIGNKIQNTGFDECFAINDSLTQTEITNLLEVGFEPAADSIPPQFFNFSNNASSDTKINDIIKWDITFTDETDLSSYIFENNFTGITSNDSSVSISGFHVVVNETLTVNVSTDNFLCGRFYVFDSAGNENVTDQSCFFTFEQPALSTVILDSSGNALNINFINENKLFTINANFTKSTGVLTGGVCNFTGENLSSHNSENNVVNFTLTSVNQLDLTIDEPINNLIEDIINFKICRNGGLANVQVFVNNTLNYTIPQGIIPSCGMSHEENRETMDFLTLNSIALSVRCSGCVGGKTMTIISNEENDRLSIDREYLTHLMPLIYNASTELYSHGAHLHKYTKVFNDLTLDIRCNETINSTTLSIGDVSPNITIIFIDDTPFTSGMQVESNESTVILIEVSGDIIRNITLNVTYENGTVIKSVNTETITLNQSELNVNGIYNISISAVDDDGNISSLIDFFQLNDTTNPVISWVFPNTLNTTTVINTTSGTDLDITLNDVNLFAYEALVFNPSNALKHNFTATDLSGTSFDITDSVVFNETGNWTIQLMVSDDHTDKLIDDYDFEIYEKEFDKKSIIFNFEDIVDNRQHKTNVSIEYIGLYVTDYLVLYKETDRYTFEYGFDIDNTVKEVRHRFRLRCGDIYHRYNSEYTAHFVCYEAKKWIDFESPDIIDYFIEDCGIGCYEIELITDSRSAIRFNSIGGLNIIEEHKNIEVNPVPPIPSLYNINLFAGNLFNKDIIDTSTIAGVLILFFLFICLVGLIFMGEHLEIPIFMIFSGIYGLFFGILVYVSISALLGVMIVIMSLMYIIRSMVFN